MSRSLNYPFLYTNWYCAIALKKIVIILSISAAVGIFLDMLTTIYIDPVDCRIHWSA